MKKIHRILMDMLIEIDQICRKYGITYYAAGGTVIGAARHNGFIPWDDDADLYMTRDEFMRFREAFKTERPENRVLECIEDNPDYPGTIPRYIDITTTNIARFDILNNCAAGVVIDIFILDPIPSDPELQRKQRNYLNVYSDVVMPFYGFSNRNDRDYLDVYQDYHKKIIHEGKAAAVKELEDMIFTYPEEQAEYYMLRWGTVPHIFPKKMMGNPVYMEYEGYSLPMPEQWYDYLVMLYGPDWYQVPAFVEDEGHVSVTNYDMPYKSYMDDAVQYLDIKKTADELFNRKLLMLKRRKLQIDFSDYEVDVQSEFVRRKLLKKIEAEGISVKEMFERGEYDRILSIFDDYLYVQLSLRFIGAQRHSHMYRFYNPKIIPLDDELFRYLIYTLLIKGDLKTVFVMDRFMNAGFKSEYKLDDVFGLAHKVFFILKSFNTGMYDDALKGLDETDEWLYEKMFLLQFIKNTILFERNDPAMTTEQIEKFVSENEGQTDALKLLADSYYRKEDFDKAKALCLKVYQSSRNGMILKEIEERFDPDIAPSYAIKYDKTVNTCPKTKTGDKMFELLKETDRICRENNIEYSLEGRTFLYGIKYGVFSSEITPPNLMMTPENALKFIEVTKDLAGDYQIRYQKNDADHLRHNIYFCDTRTTYINLFTNERTFIHVNIHILKRRGKTKAGALKTRLFEISEFMEATPLRTNMKAVTISKNAIKKYISIKGRQKFKNSVFDRQLKDGTNGKGEYYLSYNRLRQQARYYIPTDLFEEYTDVNIYGTAFRCVKNKIGYMSRAYNKYMLDEIKLRPEEFKIHFIVDTENDLKTTVDTLGLADSDSSIINDMNKSLQYTYSIRKGERQNTESFNIMKRTDARIVLAQELIPRKDEIMALFEKGDFEQLQQLLYNYDVKARYFENRKMGICFDSDIAEVYLAMLENNGEGKLASIMRKNIAAENLAPLDISIVENNNN